MGAALSDILQPSPQEGSPADDGTTTSAGQAVPGWKLARAIAFWIFMLLSIVLETCFVLVPFCLILTIANFAGIRLKSPDPGKAKLAFRLNHAYQVRASFPCTHMHT